MMFGGQDSEDFLPGVRPPGGGDRLEWADSGCGSVVG